MGNAISSAAAPALCAAFTALELFNLLDPQRTGAGSTAADRAPALRGAVRAFPPLAAAAWGLSLLAFFASVAFIYSHLRRAGAAAAAGAGNRRLPELVTFTLCASAGFLQFLLFVVQAPGGVDDGAARALGLAALRALPAAATATFFLGILLIIVGHIRAGGEGGGGAVAGVLAKMAIGAAAGLVCLMATAVCCM
ncbi:hypothetical protein C2845_PM09G05900 [Panicum miliaceum]|uniref:Uncharacterized protein n=1 Tax=Panicum miliaceum TaxID=4540 RepID=A0A3L6S0Y9_PANMI|nr:hypothetical protein C2845_PM09G05900 [Panicum miliaceum]